MIDIRRIEAKDAYDLRHLILRPHQSIEQCKYAGDLDSNTAHYGAFKQNEIVGILSIYQANNSNITISNCWQLRAMAVSEHVRGTGIGITLISEAESYAITRGGSYVWANARLKAIGFYEKAGYSTLGDEFDVPDIGPHYLILKKVI